MKLSTIVSTAVLAACACAPAAAEVVVYDFTATIYQIEASVGRYSESVDSTDFPGETIAVGQTISGRISFSTDTQPRTVWTWGNNTHSEYDNLLPISMRVDGTGIHYGTSNGQRSDILMSDRQPGQHPDGLRFSAHSEALSEADWDQPQQGVSFLFTDASSQAIGSDALAGLADLNRFPEATMTYDYTIGIEGIEAAAKLTSLTRVSPVPEPSVPLMVLTAGGVLALLRRRAVKAAA